MSKQMHHQLHCMARHIAPALLSTTLITLMFGLMFPALLQAQPVVAVPSAVNPNMATSNNAVTSSTTATGSAASDSANVTNAERLIEMLDLEKSTIAALAEMAAGLNRQIQQLSAALKARGVDPDPTTKEIDALIKRFQARVNWTQLKPVLSQIMQDSYTPEQLQAVVEFMSSPVMQGLPAKMAEANKKTEALIRAQTSQLSADIQRVVNKAVTQSSKAPAMTGMPVMP